MHVRECVLACIRSFCLCLPTTSARGAGTMYCERAKQGLGAENMCMCTCMRVHLPPFVHAWLHSFVIADLCVFVYVSTCIQ